MESPLRLASSSLEPIYSGQLPHEAGFFLYLCIDFLLALPARTRARSRGELAGSKTIFIPLPARV